MEQNNIESELLNELAFMYKKYEELCQSYKKLAQAKDPEKVEEVHDMSHMSFTQYGEEKK
jgi:hypothetical protein